MAEVAAQHSGGMTVAQYLAAKGVEVLPLDRSGAAQLGIDLTVPAGWDVLAANAFPGATAVSAEPNLMENGFAPNAVLLVGKLSATVDSTELLDCSFADARIMPGWIEQKAVSEELGGWPSRFVQGQFTADNLRLAVTTRYVVIDASDQFLVQLTVTVLADQEDRLAFDVDAINSGLVRSRS